MEHKVKVSVIGATGYTGAELVKLLLCHPGVDIDKITSESFSGEKFSQVYPHIKCDLICEELNTEEITSPLVFTALPHGTSSHVVDKLDRKNIKLIDLSADFRLKSGQIYKRWYRVTHPREDLLAEAVYGLPELYAEKIKEAELVANPGCYPTSVILALAPLLKEKLIREESITIDSKSGVSGAGRKPSLKTHFPEVNENINAYQVEGHRHTPEIEQELSRIVEAKINITFVPHLIPVNRGIFSTCYAQLKSNDTTEELINLYNRFYKDAPFVEVLPPGVFPHTREVLYTNFCRIGLYVDKRCRKVVVLSVIDNLVKGASGQAIQNMNLMCGFRQTEGLVS